MVANLHDSIEARWATGPVQLLLALGPLTNDVNEGFGKYGTRSSQVAELQEGGRVLCDVLPEVAAEAK